MLGAAWRQVAGPLGARGLYTQWLSPKVRVQCIVRADTEGMAHSFAGYTLGCDRLAERRGQLRSNIKHYSAGHLPAAAIAPVALI